MEEGRGPGRGEKRRGRGGKKELLVGDDPQSHKLVMKDRGIHAPIIGRLFKN